MKLHRQLHEDKCATEARIDPLRGKYSALERFEVPISDEEHASLDAIESSWTALLETLDSAQDTLETSKDIFKSEREN